MLLSQAIVKYRDPVLYSRFSFVLYCCQPAVCLIKGHKHSLMSLHQSFVPFWPSPQASHSSEQCPLLVIHLCVLCCSGLLYTMNHFYEGGKERTLETPQHVHYPLLLLMDNVTLYLWHMDGNLMDSQMRKTLRLSSSFPWQIFLHVDQIRIIH